MRRRTRTATLYALIAVAVAVASIAAGLTLTPSQQVSAAGQTIEVGVAGPSTHWSGPGELDLFGQQIDTRTQFAGPIRPRIKLTHITLSKQLKDFTDTGSGKDPKRSLSSALIRGFRHYLYWETVVVGLVAVLLAGAVGGWLRRGRRQSVVLIVSVLVFTEAINIGAIMVTAFSAPAKLGRVHSLQALVGDAPDLVVAPAASAAQTGGSTVVIGDSTAAGIGNRPLPHPTSIDSACQRSVDAYAVALANVDGSTVTNLACSGATVRAGLLGPQHVGSRTVPPQLGQPSVAAATTVIVSVGANDVRWSDQLLICAVSISCRNNAEQAIFQQYLARLSTDYLQLLAHLRALPKHPRVIVNLYYDPFGDKIDCLSHLGVTADKQKAMLSKLTALNQVLKSGAEAADFGTATPSFRGHGLCSKAPFVQDVTSEAPFHPTPGGELAIALADEHAMNTEH